MRWKRSFFLFITTFLFTGCHLNKTAIHVSSKPAKAKLEIFTYCTDGKEYQRFQEYKTPATFYLENNRKCKTKVIISHERYISRMMQISHTSLKRKIDREIDLSMQPIKSSKDIFISNFSIWLPKVREKVKEQKYELGMTKEQMLFSLGKPSSVNRINYAWEEWTYRKVRNKKSLRLFFKGNSIIKIED